MLRLNEVRTAALLAVLGLGLWGCGSDGITGRRGEVNASLSAAPDSSAAQAFADRIARSIALAMGEPSVSAIVRNAMRDSRFHEHKLHLRSFLVGPHGRPLLASAARAAQLSEEQFLEALSALPDVEFYMPDKAHRLNWRPGAPYYVMAVAHPKDFVNPNVTIFDTHGSARVVDVVHNMPEEAVFAILPVEADFSRPDVPPRSYHGEAVQSAQECHPLAVGCTAAAVWASSFDASIQSNISDTAFVMYRFKLRDDHDGIGSNEVESFTYVEGGPQDPDGTGHLADETGAPCYRFTGIDAGQWYTLNHTVSFSQAPDPSGSLDMTTDFYEDDTNACDIYEGPSPDDDLGRAQTGWTDLYPGRASQPIIVFVNFSPDTTADVSFVTDVNYFLSVSIDGPTGVVQGSSGTWTALAGNGTGSYSYTWYKDGQAVQTGPTYSTVMGSSPFELRVDVTDNGTGATASSTQAVESCTSATDCGDN